MELFGINTGEFLVLVVVAALLIGPKSLVQLMDLFKRGLAWLRSWSGRLREETARGEHAGLAQLDLSGLDLSEYDPRALVRQAVREEMEAWSKATSGLAAPAGGAAASNIGPSQASAPNEGDS
jgi:sec-independent protein translocase protein TatB